MGFLRDAEGFPRSTWCRDGINVLSAQIAIMIVKHFNLNPPLWKASIRGYSELESVLATVSYAKLNLLLSKRDSLQLSNIEIQKSPDPLLSVHCSLNTNLLTGWCWSSSGAILAASRGSFLMTDRSLLKNI